MKCRSWHELTNLPEALPRPSAAIYNDQLSVIGVDGDVYSCSLQALPSSDRPITSPLTLSWTPLPHPSVAHSTIASLCGQLVVIGGWQYGSTVNFIQQFVDEEWVKIGSMASCRDYCLVVSTLPGRIIIVGSGHGALKTVEECAFE